MESATRVGAGPVGSAVVVDPGDVLGYEQWATVDNPSHLETKSPLGAGLEGAHSLDGDSPVKGPAIGDCVDPIQFHPESVGQHTDHRAPDWQ